MTKVSITKAVVLEDQKTGGTVLLAVAEMGDEACNIRIPYDWETLDHANFLKDLKEQLAQDFDVSKSQVDVCENKLIPLMKQYAKWHEGINKLIIQP